MPRLMFDSTTPSAIPVTAELVGGYVNGQYAWSSADWNRFPGAQQVRINVTGDPALGNCLDVETGDATPEQAPCGTTRGTPPGRASSRSTATGLRCPR